MKISYYISVSLLLVVVCVVWWLGQQYEERAVVEILASHDNANLGLRIYAQFVATQKIFLHDIASVKRLVVPIYFPKSSEWIQVDLRSNGKLMQRWRYGSGISDEIINVEFEILPPVLLDGEIELVFSAEHIDHEKKGRSPRIFIEKSNSNYPHGNYRIANNEKDGDVGLIMIERNRKWELWYEEIVKDSILSIAFIIRGFLIVMLIVLLPQLLVRSVKRRG